MRDFKIIVVNTEDREYVHQCIEIAQANHVDNGGKLHHTDRVEFSKFVVCAVKDRKVIGFASVMTNVKRQNDIYINQLAVAPHFHHKGYGSAIMNYIIHHSSGYKFVTSGARKGNKISIKLHEKMGFKQEEGLNDNYDYVIHTQYIRQNDVMKYTEEEKENC